MFPGELKNIFAQVVKARKEGLAVLEKSRGETAALRIFSTLLKFSKRILCAQASGYAVHRQYFCLRHVTNHCCSYKK